MKGRIMTTQILGEKRSPRRRWTLLLPLIAAFTLGMFYVAGAQAVHDDGFFQLDRNAFTSDLSNAATPPGVHDWDQVYDSATYGSPGTTIKSFQTDGANATIFTGGGSKDTLNIPSWKHTDGSVPDKDNLLHGYAAQYADNLYFGADRFDGNGTATLGVWFFQSAVAPLANGTFSGSHVNGDVLVLTDFQSSGANATVRVFQWAGGPSGGPVLIAGSATAPQDCVGPPSVSDGDPYCGTTNAANTASPWPFTPKVPVGTNVFPVGHFFEGGIDLAALNLGGECFSSFLAETRTSNSIGSQLKDFVTGQLASCDASVTTTPTSSSITLGDHNHDYALIEGSGGSDAPTGTMSFSICSPAQLTNGACESGGTPVSTNPVTPIAGTTNGESTSDAYTPNAVGTWCWRGVYSGDSNYPTAS